jgi:hypothetical protein
LPTSRGAEKCGRPERAKQRCFFIEGVKAILAIKPKKLVVYSPTWIVGQPRALLR